MKGILVKTTGEIQEIEVGTLPWEAISILLGKNIAVMQTDRLEDPYCLISNIDFALKGAPENAIGCYLAEEEVYGNAVILKSNESDGESEFIGLDDDDVIELAFILDDVMQELEKKEAV